ncbi:MAG: cyclic nucleotide-binding domain-containing protein [Bdellovibrionales bacterium]
MMEKFKDNVSFYWEYFFKNEENSEQVSQTKFLQSLPFFSKLSLRQIRVISEYLHYREYADDEYLFEYGTPGAALFLIFEGSVAIEVPTPSGVNQVAILEDNSFLGELALLSSAERTASARCIKKSKCFALYRNDLDRLADSSPEICAEIYKSLAKVVGRRLEATTKQITSFKEKHGNKNNADAA